MKIFETREQASEWWNSWASKLMDDGMCILDVANLDDEVMFAAMAADGYNPESAKQFL